MKKGIIALIHSLHIKRKLKLKSLAKEDRKKIKTNMTMMEKFTNTT